MRKFTLVGLGIVIFSNVALQAQNFVNGGNNLSANGRIGTNSNHSLIFETSNLERTRLTNAGLWGIGTTAPVAKLHINSLTNQEPFRVQINGVTKFFVHRGGGVSVGTYTAAPDSSLLVSGNVAIGTTIFPSTPYKLDVVNGSTNISSTAIAGDGRSVGVLGYSIEGKGIFGLSYSGRGGYFHSEYDYGLYAFTYFGGYAAYFDGDTFANGNYLSSDKNLKKNIQEMGSAMSIINRLKPKYYQFKDDGIYASMRLPKGNHFGLLAQDVEEVLPELVKESSHIIGKRGVSYIEMI